jgi:hypothetical protein
MYSACNFCQLLKKLQMLTDIKKLLKHQMSRKSVQWEPSCSIRMNG